MATKKCILCGNKPRIEKEAPREWWCECPICEPDGRLWPTRREAMAAWNVFNTRTRKQIAAERRNAERQTAYE